MNHAEMMQHGMGQHEMGMTLTAQVEETPEPIEFGIAEAFDGDPVVGAAEDGAQREVDDVQQRVFLASLDPRVSQSGEVIQPRQAFFRKYV